jgi:hypothetical protein
MTILVFLKSAWNTLGTSLPRQLHKMSPQTSTMSEYDPVDIPA